MDFFTALREILDMMYMLVIVLIIPIITFVFTVKNNRRNSYRKRVEKFSNMRKTSAERSHEIRKEIREKGFEGYPYLIHLEKWNHKKGISLLEIDEIQLVADDKAYDYRKIKRYIKRKILLPNKHLSIVDNLKKYESGKLYDNPSYGISRIEDDKDVMIFHVKRNSYFEFVNTCFGYEFEAAYEKMKNSKKFLLRRKYPIMDFTNRFASFGIVTFVIIRNVLSENGKIDNYCLIHTRSDDVSESKGLVNAVPGATFQPSNVSAQKELAEALEIEGIKYTIVREFCEEILGDEMFSELPDSVLVEKSEAWKMLDGNIYYLGCGINSINAYLEMLTCAVIDMKTDIAKKYFYNQDDDSAVSKSTNKTKSMLILPLAAKNSKKCVSKSMVEKMIKANFEGEIELKKISKDELKFLEGSVKSTPALRQICKILIEDYDNISSQLGL